MKISFASALQVGSSMAEFLEIQKPFYQSLLMVEVGEGCHLLRHECHAGALLDEEGVRSGTRYPGSKLVVKALEDCCCQMYLPSCF